MKSDDHIRYATICDMEGTELARRIREGVKLLLNDAEHKETLRYAVNSWKARNKLSPKLGKAHYVLAVYDDLRRLTMPIGDKFMLLITWGPDGGTLDIFRHLRKTLQET
jgi:hypothetical protein